MGAGTIIQIPSWRFSLSLCLTMNGTVCIVSLITTRRYIVIFHIRHIALLVAEEVEGFSKVFIFHSCRKIHMKNDGTLLT